MRDEDKKVTSLENEDRRLALKKILVGAGVATSSFIVPLSWKKPLVSLGVLPAHAATSEGGEVGDGGTTLPPPSGYASIPTSLNPVTQGLVGCGETLDAGNPSLYSQITIWLEGFLPDYPINYSVPAGYAIISTGPETTTDTSCCGMRQAVRFMVTTKPGSYPGVTITIGTGSTCVFHVIWV